MKYRYTEEELKNAVKQSFSLAGVCRLLGIRPAGGNYAIIKQKIKRLEIDTSHFTGQGWNVGIRAKRTAKSQPMSEILVKDSTYMSTNKLRKRLITEGYKSYKCESCGLVEWLGKPIKLELHHKNGDNSDNRLENLLVLCPNCHAYTDTYRGKNKLSAISEKRLVEYRKFEETLTGSADGNREPSPEMGRCRD